MNGEDYNIIKKYQNMLLGQITMVSLEELVSQDHQYR